MCFFKTRWKSATPRKQREPGELELAAQGHGKGLSSKEILLTMFEAVVHQNEGFQQALEAMLEDVFPMMSESDIYDLFLLTALISCGLDEYAFEWAKENFTPFLHKYKGSWLLVLGYAEIINEHSGRESKIGVAENNGHMALLLGYEEEPRLFSRCLLPIGDISGLNFRDDHRR